MWLLGLILLVIAALIHSAILFWIGLILFLVGVAMYFVPSRADSRRWYW
jgi:membrane protein implicated in regulation of membrane protease activity